MILAVAGQTLLLAALVASVLGAVASWAGGRRLAGEAPQRAADAQGWTGVTSADAGSRATIIVLVTSAVATLLLLIALVTGDQTLAYVHARTSNDLSLGFRVTALWSGQEGSLLFWLVLLAAYGSLMLRSLTRAQVSGALRSYANAVVLSIAAFFALLVAVVARPFAVVDQLARDGSGMSPSLQNYWMALHPPTLYLGYVGVAIPFAIVVGALLSRQRDDAWIATTRTWALVAWCCLSLGLLLGARWAYEEIGWGGYWAWDPVENAALMPWLTVTALLHSIMVQQRRGMMRFWNAVLAALTFALSIFGTFLTRSGVLSSVHAFVSSPVGWWFIGALTVLAVAVLVLLFTHRVHLRARHDVDAVVSREGMLLFNNLLLVALALVVLWGVVYPLLTAALSNSRISLEKPWYDFFATAFGLPLTAFVAFAPFVAWQGTPWRRVLRSMLVPACATAVLGIVLIVTGFGTSPAGVAAVCLGALTVCGVVADWRRSLRAHAAAGGGESQAMRWWHVARRHRRRWGAWIAHAALGLLVIAIAGGAWGTSRTVTLTSGEQLRIGAYEVTFRRVDRARHPSYMATRAVFDVRRGSTAIGQLHAGRNFYPASGEMSNEVAVHHDWLRMQDLFVTTDMLASTREVRAKVLVNPLVPLLWLAGLLLVAGAVVAAPARRRVDSNDGKRVRIPHDALHGLRNGTAAPGELLPGMRRTARSPDV